MPIFGALPDGYEQALYWRVTDKPVRFVGLQLLSVICLVIFGAVFFSLAITLGKLPSQLSFGLGEIGLVLLGILLTLVLHELTHGVVMKLFGAKPSYGILWKQFMLYTTSPGFVYRRNNFAAITLAPFILISVLVILGMGLLQGTFWVALLGLCGAINSSGAAGDIWATAIVLRYSPTALVMDERDGIRVFLAKQQLDRETN